MAKLVCKLAANVSYIELIVRWLANDINILANYATLRITC